MNVDRLARQLRNEFRRSPGKSGLLALLALVGLYFYVPVVWGWLAPANLQAETHSAAVASRTTNPSMRTSEPNAEPADTRQMSFDWRPVAAAIEADPQMAPGTAWLAERDPFAWPPYNKSQAERSADETSRHVVITPQDAGLVLTSTVIGSGRAVAVVNGRTYIEGSTISTDSGTAFEMITIGPRKVVLERLGQQFELSIEMLNE